MEEKIIAADDERINFRNIRSIATRGGSALKHLDYSRKHNSFEIVIELNDDSVSVIVFFSSHELEYGLRDIYRRLSKVVLD